jgi:hypothetical protein
MPLYRAAAVLRSPLAIVLPRPFVARSARSAAKKARTFLKTEDWGCPEQLYVCNIANPADALGDPIGEV